MISRARSRRVDLELPDAPITEEQVGAELLALVARAQAQGLDPDQALRDAVRQLEQRVREAEASTGLTVKRRSL